MGYEPEMLSESEVEDESRRLKNIVRFILIAALITMLGALVLTSTIVPNYPPSSRMSTPTKTASQLAWLPDAATVSSVQGFPGTGDFKILFKLTTVRQPLDWMKLILSKNDIGGPIKPIPGFVGLSQKKAPDHYQELTYDKKTATYRFERHAP